MISIKIAHKYLLVLYRMNTQIMTFVSVLRNYS